MIHVYYLTRSLLHLSGSGCTTKNEPAHTPQSGCMGRPIHEKREEAINYGHLKAIAIQLPGPINKGQRMTLMLTLLCSLTNQLYKLLMTLPKMLQFRLNEIMPRNAYQKTIQGRMCCFIRFIYVLQKVNNFALIFVCTHGNFSRTLPVLIFIKFLISFILY